MSKKTKGGSGNVLLLAGLGVGAFMLFAGKSNAQSGTSSGMPEGNSGSDIPDAPKILAVNSSDTESPTPTGIVSDEEGMETVNSQSSGSSSTQSSSSSSGDSDGDDAGGGNTVVKTIANAGVKVIQQAMEDIPKLVSTKLTPKETSIINSGKLTAALALKRPDLYKAAYIKKYGGKTAEGKRKALVAASLAIDAAVNAAQAAKTGGLTKAIKYPAKPQFTFVQTAGGMAAQMAVSQIAALQKAGVQVSPAAQKVSAQVKAAKGSKGRRPAKGKPAAKTQPVRKRVIARPVTKSKPVQNAGKKKAVRKRH